VCVVCPTTVIKTTAAKKNRDDGHDHSLQTPPTGSYCRQGCCIFAHQSHFVHRSICITSSLASSLRYRRVYISSTVQCINMKFFSVAFSLALCGSSLSLVTQVSAFVTVPPLTAVSSLPSSSSSLYMSTSESAATTKTGVARNPNFAKLQGGYLFPEIGRRRNAYLAENPEMASRIISLGIGDTTQPVPSHILQGLVQGAQKLGSPEGYTGYGAEQGMQALREKIASKLYGDRISADEVFVSDGAKCDIMRLQQMFGSGVVSAVQDPSYPVYVDTSVMMGQTFDIDSKTNQYGNIVYMPCTPENGFFPDYSKLPRADVVYLCSPK